MDQSGTDEPGHEGRVFYRVPKPPTAPAEFVISPPASQRNADSQKHPGYSGPWTRPTGPRRIETAANQCRDRKCKGAREAHVTHVEHWWVCDHCRVLEQRIEISSIRSRWNQARKRIGRQQHEQQEADADYAH